MTASSARDLTGKLTFGQQARIRRLALGLTLIDISCAVGVHENTVGEWENHPGKLKPEHRRRLDGALSLAEKARGRDEDMHSDDTRAGVLAQVQRIVGEALDPPLQHSPGELKALRLSGSKSPNGLGPTLTRRRDELGISVKELAAAVGVTTNRVKWWEQGDEAPIGDSRARLFAVLQLLDHVAQFVRNEHTGQVMDPVAGSVLRNFRTQIDVVLEYLDNDGQARATRDRIAGIDLPDLKI